MEEMKGRGSSGMHQGDPFPLPVPDAVWTSRSCEDKTDLKIRAVCLPSPQLCGKRGGFLGHAHVKLAVTETVYYVRRLNRIELEPS